MIARLSDQPWLTAPETRAVMDALEARGGAGCARFVGGAVRNALLGAPVEDVDIATTLTPPVVMEALQAARLKAVPTGVDHGTVTAVSGGRPFEITTLRRDVETDGRRAVVAFTEDWAEDAQRRDFTLNALYADRNGEVIDPVRAGVADAAAGRIVFVGDARTRIAEDYLRILRFFRFHAWYGRGEPDRAALEACETMRSGMKRLAAERISKELLKLLAAPDPRGAVELMARTGVLAETLPVNADLSRLSRLVSIEAELGLPPDPVLRLAALLPNDAAQGVRVAQALRLSNDQRDRLAAALAQTPPLASDLPPGAVRGIVYEIGAATFSDRLLLAWAGQEMDGSGEAWRSLRAAGLDWARPTFPLSGEDALAAGAPRGPAVGAALREAERWWIAQDFAPDRAALLARLKTVVGEAS